MNFLMTETEHDYHDGCGGFLTWEQQPRYAFRRPIDNPVVSGKEWMVRCDRCHLIGLPVIEVATDNV